MSDQNQNDQATVLGQGQQVNSIQNSNSKTNTITTTSSSIVTQQNCLNVANRDKAHLFLKRPEDALLHKVVLPRGDSYFQSNSGFTNFDGVQFDTFSGSGLLGALITNSSGASASGPSIHDTRHFDRFVEMPVNAVISELMERVNKNIKSLQSILRNSFHPEVSHYMPVLADAQTLFDNNIIRLNYMPLIRNMILYELRNVIDSVSTSSKTLENVTYEIVQVQNYITFATSLRDPGTVLIPYRSTFLPNGTLDNTTMSALVCVFLGFHLADASIHSAMYQNFALSQLIMDDYWSKNISAPNRKVVFLDLDSLDTEVPSTTLTPVFTISGMANIQSQLRELFSDDQREWACFYAATYLKRPIQAISIANVIGACYFPLAIKHDTPNKVAYIRDNKRGCVYQDSRYDGRSQLIWYLSREGLNTQFTLFDYMIERTYMWCALRSASYELGLRERKHTSFSHFTYIHGAYPFAHLTLHNIVPHSIDHQEYANFVGTYYLYHPISILEQFGVDIDWLENPKITMRSTAQWNHTLNSLIQHYEGNGVLRDVYFYGDVQLQEENYIGGTHTKPLLRITATPSSADGPWVCPPLYLCGSKSAYNFGSLTDRTYQQQYRHFVNTNGGVNSGHLDITNGGFSEFSEFR